MLNKLNILFFLFSFKLISFPYSIDYLRKENINVILISDFHGDYPHRKNIIKQKKLSTLEQGMIVTDAEKALLKKIIQNDDKNIDIICEIDEEELISNKYNNQIVIDLGKYLSKQIKMSKIVPAEKFRLYSVGTKKYPQSLGMFVRSLLRLSTAIKEQRIDLKMLKIDSKIFIEMFKIDPKVLVEIYKNFLSIIEKIVKLYISRNSKNLDEKDLWIFNDINNFYEEYVKGYERLSDDELFSLILKYIDQDEYVNKLNDGIYSGIFDMNVLLKIFSSKSNNFIVYAGGLHCNNIKNKLLDHGFNLQHHKGSELKCDIGDSLVYSQYILLNKFLEPEDFDIIDSFLL